MGLQDTPRANRPHIGLFGNRNAGKSSLLNAITGQAKSLVSPVAGTTTDLVYQTFELERLGPVVFIDTAGLDDSGPLGPFGWKRPGRLWIPWTWQSSS